MAESFRTMIRRERKRLARLERDARKRLGQIEKELSDIASEVSAIFAYESAKTGKKRITKRRPRKGGKRASRGARREAVLKVVGKNGATRGEIIEKLGARGNKREEQAISNALALMKRAKVLKSKDGKYMTA